MQTPPIRPATLDDIPELVRLINAAFRVEDHFKAGDRTDAATVLEYMSGEKAAFLVIDGSVPGALAAAIFVEQRGERGYFGMLSVDPSRQGEGLGRVLIHAAEERFKAAGCTHLDLTIVNLRFELPALYAKFGFVESGDIPFPSPEDLTQPAHLVQMSKPLT